MARSTAPRNDVSEAVRPCAVAVPIAGPTGGAAGVGAGGLLKRCNVSGRPRGGGIDGGRRALALARAASAEAAAAGAGRSGGVAISTRYLWLAIHCN